MIRQIKRPHPPFECPAHSAFAQDEKPARVLRSRDVECFQQCEEVLVRYKAAHPENYRRTGVPEPMMIGMQFG